MARTLRHVTIPDTHDRIPVMRPEGKAKINAAPSEILTDLTRRLARKIVLSDGEWTVLYEVKDELRDRGEWDDSLMMV